jgi:hypothetical protein
MRTFIVRIAVVLLVASCTSSAPSAEQTCLSGRRLDFLTNQFFVTYNARDMDGFLALFNFSASAGGGGFAQYYDNPGEPTTARDRSSLASYLQRRWTIGDRFVSWRVGPSPDGLNYPNANPTVNFTRAFAAVMQDGNAKLVCNAGLLVGVVMSSGQP